MADHGWLTADGLEFAPDIVKAQEAPPLRYRRYVLYALLALFAALLTWAVFGRLDIVAISQGSRTVIGLHDCVSRIRLSGCQDFSQRNIRFPPLQ